MRSVHLNALPVQLLHFLQLLKGQLSWLVIDSSFPELTIYFDFCLWVYRVASHGVILFLILIILVTLHIGREVHDRKRGVGGVLYLVFETSIYEIDIHFNNYSHRFNGCLLALPHALDGAPGSSPQNAESDGGPSH